MPSIWSSPALPLPRRRRLYVRCFFRTPHAMPSNGRAPCSLLSRMRAPRCFSASAACSCDRRDVWYMVYSCYLFRFLSYYSMARVDVVTSAPCLSSRSTVSWSSQIRRAVCTSVVEADVSVWPRCFLAVCLQLCCVRSLIDIYITRSLSCGGELTDNRPSDLISFKLPTLE